MPKLTVTATTATKVIIPDPDGGTLVSVPGNSAVTVDVSLEDLEQLRNKARPTDAFSIIDALVDRGLITYSIDAEESAGLVLGHQEITITRVMLNAAVDQNKSRIDLTTGVVGAPASAKLPKGSRILGAWWTVDVAWVGPIDGGAFDGLSVKVGSGSEAAGATTLTTGFTGGVAFGNANGEGFFGIAAGVEAPAGAASFANLGKRNSLWTNDEEFRFRFDATDDENGAQADEYDMSKITAGQQTLHIMYAVLGTGKDI